MTQELAAVSLIGIQTYRQLYAQVKLEPPSARLMSCIYGRCDPTSRRNKGTLGYEGQTKVVKLVVMKKEGLSLMGRDWIELVKLN